MKIRIEVHMGHNTFIIEENPVVSENLETISSDQMREHFQLTLSELYQASSRVIEVYR